MPVDYVREAAIAYLGWVADEEADRQAWLRTLRAYAKGDHPTYLTDRQKEFLGLKAKNSNYLYAHNLCKLIIDGVTERLHLTGFAPANEEDADAEAVCAKAGEWLEFNRMDANQDTLHEAAIRDGEAYVIVHWPDGAQYPQWAVNMQTDGTQGVSLHRDPVTNEPLFAVKRWQETESATPGAPARTRLTMYYSDRVERYISAPAGKGMRVRLRDREVEVNWQPYDPDGQGWPIWWTTTGTKEGKPLGLPVIAFQNTGGSEIADVVPLQDMVNKADLDLVACTDAAGFRMLVLRGVPEQIDPDTGEAATITISPGQLMRLDSPEASLEAIDPVDPTNMIAASRYWIESVAGISRTPQYLLEGTSGAPPSGESLRMRDLGLVAKAERKQAVFGNAWEDVIAISVRLWNRQMPAEVLPEGVRVEAVWQDAEIEDPVAQTTQAKDWLAVGVPQELIWQECLGFDADMIAKAKAMQAEQQAAQANIGSELLRAFEGGGNLNLRQQQV